MTDPYSVLGVSRDASDEEIKKAYRTAQQKVSSGRQYQQSEQGAGGREV